MTQTPFSGRFAPTSIKGKSPRQAALIFILITVTLDILSVAIVVPVIPHLVEEFTGSVNQASWMIGIFGFLWALMQFIFSPLLGSLSDRFGRRPVILLSNLGLGLDYLLLALAPSLAWMVVARLISGITSASVTV
ncbi:MAG: MFS transporter, partial [Alphaproteobacteria bacterium]|nr:MFS transporter [Alphaproteobacteria bacterium]